MSTSIVHKHYTNNFGAKSKLNGRPGPDVLVNYELLTYFKVLRGRIETDDTFLKL